MMPHSDDLLAYAQTVELKLDRLTEVADQCEYSGDYEVFWEKVRVVTPFFLSRFRPRLRNEDRTRLFARFESLCARMRDQYQKHEGTDKRGHG
jgi:hypothetical protein